MIEHPADRPLRILLSIHHPLNRDSGAAGVVMRIAEEYRALGHEVKVASHDDLSNWIPRSARELYFPFRLAAMVRDWRPDVVDASSGDGWVSFGSADPGGPLRVTHSHGLEQLSSEREMVDDRAAGRPVALSKRIWRHGIRLRLVTRSFRRADLSLVLNDAEADHLAGVGIAASDIRRIRLGTDHAGIPRSGHVRDPGAVVQIGAYSKRKGVAVTAPAMSRVMAAVPSATMTFIGTGVPRDRVLGNFPSAFHARITVVERYANADLPALLAGKSLCLMPSLFEGYGIAKLEAMACGLIVVVSDDPGARADVEHEINGIVVARGDADALFSAIRHLIEQPKQSSALRRSGTVTAARFSWPAVAHERIGFYRERIERRRSEPCATMPQGDTRGAMPMR